MSDTEIKIAIRILQQLLSNPALSIYCAVVLAQRDLKDNNLKAAVFRLLSECDKLRMYDPKLPMYLSNLNKRLAENK